MVCASLTPRLHALRRLATCATASLSVMARSDREYLRLLALLLVDLGLSSVVRSCHSASQLGVPRKVRSITNYFVLSLLIFASLILLS